MHFIHQPHGEEYQHLYTVELSSIVVMTERTLNTFDNGVVRALRKAYDSFKMELGEISIWKRN